MRQLSSKESLHNTLAFNARDWSEDKADAWLWGIIIGWDKNSMEEIQQKHGWTEASVKRLRTLHKEFLRLK